MQKARKSYDANLVNWARRLSGEYYALARSKGHLLWISRLTRDGNSNTVNGVSMARTLGKYFAIVGVSALVFLGDLDIPPQTPDIDELQITDDMTGLNLDNTNFGESAGSDEDRMATGKLLPDR